MRKSDTLEVVLIVAQKNVREKNVEQPKSVMSAEDIALVECSFSTISALQLSTLTNR